MDLLPDKKASYRKGNGSRIRRCSRFWGKLLAQEFQITTKMYRKSFRFTIWLVIWTEWVKRRFSQKPSWSVGHVDAMVNTSCQKPSTVFRLGVSCSSQVTRTKFTAESETESENVYHTTRPYDTIR